MIIPHKNNYLSAQKAKLLKSGFLHNIASIFK